MVTSFLVQSIRSVYLERQFIALCQKRTLCTRAEICFKFYKFSEFKSIRSNGYINQHICFCHCHAYSTYITSNKEYMIYIVCRFPYILIAYKRCTCFAEVVIAFHNNGYTTNWKKYKQICLI